jgi:hypothetical protein
MGEERKTLYCWGGGREEQHFVRGFPGFAQLSLERDRVVGSSGFVARDVESLFSELMSNCIIWKEKKIWWLLEQKGFILVSKEQYQLVTRESSQHLLKDKG